MEPLDLQVIRQAALWQAQGDAAVLVTVARTWGSSPRPPGSLMAIRDDGASIGSVSGGCIEDDLVLRIREGGALAACPGRRPARVRYGVSAEQAQRFGLPCGGTVELVLEPLGPHSRLSETLQALAQRQVLRRVLDLETGQVALAPGGADGLPSLVDNGPVDGPVDGPWSEAGRRLVLHLGPQARLVVIGAGDLARYLCEMACGMGFDVVVCDPRPEQAGWTASGATFSREMPDDLVRRLQPDPRTAVVAVAHDPKLDDLALIDALQTPAFYVGAIGSRRNSALRRARLQEHFGLTEAQLDRLHGPAGVYIGSKTPAEIALSILAEVVAAKNGVALPGAVAVAEGKRQRPAGLPHASCGVASGS